MQPLVAMHDIRAAIRALARRPGFAFIAVVTLALGIGGNAAIFSIIDTVLLRALPYPRADRLMMIWEHSDEVQQRIGFDTLPSSPGDVTDFRRRNRTFTSLGWVRSERFNLTGGGDPERLTGVRVSTDFFDVLGVHAAVGRTFAPDDGTAARVAVIGDRLWRRRFGAAPDIIGRAVSLNAMPVTVVGVLPDWFRFPADGDLPAGLGFSGDVDIWAADVLTPAQQRSRGGKSFALVGRLKDEASIASATADLNRIAADIATESPESNAGWTVLVRPFREQLVGSVRTALVVLLVAVGCVLLIACANVANLMLARAAGRHREMCVRLALGAGEGRLIRQTLVESLVLSVAAGTAGLLVAWVGVRVLLLVAPARFGVFSGATLQWRVLVFTIFISLLTGVLFGIVPAMQAARADLNDGLRDGSRGTSGSWRARRTRDLLVVTEVALAMVLLVGAVLLLQTFVRLLHVDAGFRPDGVLTMEVSLPRASYSGSRAADFFDQVTARLAGVAGVEGVAVTSSLPLSGTENLRQITVEGRPRPLPGQEIIGDYRVVTPDYFRVMGVRHVAGETMPRTLTARAPLSALISATMAETVWKEENPIGRKIKLTSFDQDGPWFTVTGVVGDTRHTGLDSSLRPQVYVEQRVDPSPQMVVVLRTAGDPLGYVAAARASVLETDRNQPVGRIRPMKAVVADSVSNRRFTMALVATFATLAFTLALIGLYAVVSHSVAERTTEMGVRLAMGASPGALLRLVLSEGLRLTAIGVACGVTGAFLITRFMSAMLFGVSPNDVLTFVIVSLLLFTAAGLGCLVPARRAMRVDPIVALRAE
jgi:putative ABC transport system permease protein